MTPTLKTNVRENPSCGDFTMGEKERASFFADFSDFISRRWDDQIIKLRKAGSFKKAEEKYLSTQEKLMKSLTPEQMKLFRAFDSAEGVHISETIDNAYLLGLCDGQMIQQKFLHQEGGHQ